MFYSGTRGLFIHNLCFSRVDLDLKNEYTITFMAIQQALTTFSPSHLDLCKTRETQDKNERIQAENRSDRKHKAIET